MVTILICGAGQLGSRYLQGLAHCRIPLQIHVCDLRPESLALANQRWHEAKSTTSIHDLFFHIGLNDVPQKLTVVVLATTADSRPHIASEISRHAKVEFWILEKILAQSCGALNELVSGLGENARAWVNTPRRMMQWHSDIKRELGFCGPVTLKMSGAGWGLACNSVHFLDLLSWWTGESLQSLDTEELDSFWFESKRKGFYEVTGTLTARFSGGSAARLMACPEDCATLLEATDGNIGWQIDEPAGVAQRSDGLTVTGRLAYQSEMSGPLVESLIKTETCALPSLCSTVELHRDFIRAMHEHWRRSRHEPKAANVPIT